MTAVPMEMVPPSTTILFIDGHDHDRQYWVKRLTISSPDYAILEADTGAAGLSICQLHQIDCVVTELALPDMSGFKILIDLVPRILNPQIAVIILSRLNFQTLAELALLNGAQAYLVKSRISGDDLDSTIHKALVTVGPTRKEGACRLPLRSRDYGTRQRAN
jgi:DNA-binding NarL/FixJ family response regulator